MAFLEGRNAKYRNGKNAGIMWSEMWKTTGFQNTGMESLGRLDHRKI
jgi:hypothetical protein